jgi:NO-binding membrane sensor protein with MHYT domain/signal transduction histidine kinase
MFDSVLTGNEVVGSYNLGLVCLSFVIAVVASYTALDLALRIGESYGITKKIWIGGCAFSMGGGIWSMHFTAMLAYQLPFEVSYDIWITLLSIIISIIASGIGLFLASAKPISISKIAMGGMIMGIGVASMHYTGMAAMGFAGSMYYKLGLFVLSIMVAILAATAALWLIINLSIKEQGVNALWKFIGALVMGLAVFGMHYTGMAATIFVPHGDVLSDLQVTSDMRLLAFGISGITLFTLSFTIIASITQKEFNLLRGVKNELEVLVQERTKDLKALSTFPSESLDPVFRVDSNNVLIYSNQSGLSVLKYWEGEVGIEIPAPFIQTLNEVQFNGKRKNLEIHLDNQVFVFSIVSIPAMNYCNIYGQDITERKKAESKIEQYAKALERSNNALQEFASMASHDLQEPPRKIITFGNQLKHIPGNSDKRSEDYLNRMQQTAARMQTLILDLLRYSQVHTEAKPPRQINLRNIVDEVIEILEKRISETRGTIIIDSLPALHAQDFQMRELFQNLIGNALKYHREGVYPVIKIKSCQMENQHWKITVEDNGIGFDEKHKNKIFSPFHRLHGRSAYEGTGMGLAICKKIVDRHRGTITAQSTPEKGSTFIIILPGNVVANTTNHQTP